MNSQTSKAIGHLSLALNHAMILRARLSSRINERNKWATSHPPPHTGRALDQYALSAHRYADLLSALEELLATLYHSSEMTNLLEYTDHLDEDLDEIHQEEQLSIFGDI